MTRAVVARLAMRRRGDWWVAYIAAPETMRDAVEIGSIHVSAVIHVTRDAECRRNFVRIMQAQARQTVEQSRGIKVEYRGGRAVPAASTTS